MQMEKLVKVKKEKSPDYIEQSGVAGVPLPPLPDVSMVESRRGKHNIIEPLIHVSSADEQVPEKRIRCSDMEEWFDDVVITGITKQPSVDVIQEEVRKYLFLC